MHSYTRARTTKARTPRTICNYDALKYVFNCTPLGVVQHASQSRHFLLRACRSARRVWEIRRLCTLPRSLNRRRFSLANVHRRTLRQILELLSRSFALSLSSSPVSLSPFSLMHVVAIFHEQTSRLWKTLTRVILRTAPEVGG